MMSCRYGTYYRCKINKNNKPLNTPLHLLGLSSSIMFGISEWQIKKRRRSRRSICFLLDIKVPKSSVFLDSQ
jgi:hypothetical protein